MAKVQKCDRGPVIIIYNTIQSRLFQAKPYLLRLWFSCVLRAQQALPVSALHRNACAHTQQYAVG